MTAQTILPANTLSSGFDVANSLRFNDDSSDYLSQTYSSSGNQRTFTISFWFKRSNVVSGNIYTYQDASNEIRSEFILVSNTLKIVFNPTGSQWSSDMIVQENGANYLFRDHSAWYHVVMAIDTTQGTEANRIKVYINGNQKAMSAYPSENFDTGYNTDIVHSVGSYIHAANTFFDGYFAEFCVIDGSQLAATSFGEFDEDSAIWKPKNPAGLTFGTNGFYLQFKESGTSANASGMGADTSGNDHHFTVHNLTAVDQSTDTCTNNFCVMNPNDNVHGGGTFENGNLQVTSRNTGYTYNTGTFGVAGGKWYWEVKWSAQDTGSTNQVLIGVAKRPSSSTTNYLGVSAWGYGYQGSNGYVLLSNSNLITYASYSVGDIVGVALDMDNNRLYFSKNGTYNNSSDPANGTNPISITAPDSTNADSGFYFPAFGDGNNNLVETGQFNFGGGSVHAISSGNADANGFGNFEYAVPSGYLALCTKNLAENS